jgi:UPF0716 family protein affecting phage T7 exclusion
MIAWLFANIGDALTLAMIFIGAVLGLRIKWRADGKAAVRKANEARRRELQEAFDEIDTKAPDPAGAYDRLRGLSGDRR